MPRSLSHRLLQPLCRRRPFWFLSADSGTTYGVNSSGTTDNHLLELRADGQPELRLERSAAPMLWPPDVIGGWGNGAIPGGVQGATISGDGGSSGGDWIYDDYGAVGGGARNMAGNSDDPTSVSTAATLGGGSRH